MVPTAQIQSWEKRNALTGIWTNNFKLDPIP